MKYLTLNKKLINKIRPLDLLIGGFFVIVGISLLLLFHRTNVYVDIRVRVTDQDVLYANTNPKTWYANRFVVGDTEKNELGQVVGKITNVETFSISPDSKVVFLDINLKANYNKRTGTYTVGGTNLIFGNTLRFNFSDIFFNGIITEAPGAKNQVGYSEEQKTITLIVRGYPKSLADNYRGVEPQVLEKIRKGDIITNSNGIVLATVEDIVLTPALRIVQTSDGKLFRNQDPYYKDATITMNIKVKKYNEDEFVFDIVPFKIGTEIPLNFNEVSIWPLLVEVK